MNTDDYEKTPDRQPQGGVSSDAKTPEKIAEIGGLASPRAVGDAAGGDGAAVAGVLMEAEEPEERGRGAPKKAGRARKDALRAYAASLGAEPGELLLATVMEGLQDYLDQGGQMTHWLERRAKMLARALPCRREDAFKLLVKMLGDAMPYTHQKLPLAVEIDDGAVMFAMIGSDGKVISNQRGGLDMRPANVRAPVSISDKTGVKSDGKSRTDEGNDQ